MSEEKLNKEEVLDQVEENIPEVKVYSSEEKSLMLTEMGVLATLMGSTYYKPKMIPATKNKGAILDRSIAMNIYDPNDILRFKKRIDEIGMELNIAR